MRILCSIIGVLRTEPEALPSITFPNPAKRGPCSVGELPCYAQMNSLFFGPGNLLPKTAVNRHFDRPHLPENGQEKDVFPVNSRKTGKFKQRQVRSRLHAAPFSNISII